MQSEFYKQKRRTDGQRRENIKRNSSQRDYYIVAAYRAHTGMRLTVIWIPVQESQSNPESRTGLKEHEHGEMQLLMLEDRKRESICRAAGPSHIKRNTAKTRSLGEQKKAAKNVSKISCNPIASKIRSEVIE
jgi:hypothetical protein